MCFPVEGLLFFPVCKLLNVNSTCYPYFPAGCELVKSDHFVKYPNLSYDKLTGLAVKLQVSVHISKLSDEG
jgi:hypothetical protein